MKPDGLTAVTLGSFQENPVTFHVLPAGVTATAEGHDYEGPLLMEVPGRGFHKIEGAKVSFLGGTDVASPLDISGEVTLPLPRFGLFEALHLNAPGACKLGFGPGSSEKLQALEALVRPERHYLYATCSVSFEMAIGTTWFDSPSGKDYTVVIDPFDPSVYLHGDVDGLPGFGPLREVGVGLSSQGLFPYAPFTSWGVESHVSSFEGHVGLDGVVEVWAKLPFELFSLDIEGAAVVDLDPNDDGTPATLGKPDMRLGANGKLTAELRFFKAISLGLDLAEASLMATLSGDTREVAISGMAGPTELRLPEKLPLIPKGALKVAAFVTDEFGSSYVVAEGVFTFRGSDFNLPFIPDLLDVDLNVRLEIDADGARLTGTLDTAIHPWLEFTGGLEFEAELAWDGSHFHVLVKGDMDFDLPTGLTPAIEIYFGSDDIRINGSSIPFL